jgi:sulfur-oxidizing protein SoxA
MAAEPVSVAKATESVSDVKAAEPVSGYDFLQKETQEMQDDEFLNPGMQWVEAGKEMFNGLEGKDAKTCASCHGKNGSQLDPKRIAQYPVYNERLGKPVTLQGQIRACWSGRLGYHPLPYDTEGAVKLEAFVHNLARGEKVNVQTDGPMKPYYERGEAIYGTRVGQLDMACSACHDENAGKKIRGNTLSQGQANGSPAYRLRHGKVEGLHSTFNECYRLFRASEMPPGNDDYMALEVYVRARGNGLTIETPAVRF